MDTSGLTTDGASSGSTGLHTSALQNGTLPSGFNGSNTSWNLATNSLYPSLGFSGVPQIISGTVRDLSNNSVGSSSSVGIVTVSSLVNGSQSSSATAGANGVYYMLQPANTFSGTNQLLTYVDNSVSSSGVVANDYFQNITSSQFGADLVNARLLAVSSIGTLSGLYAGISTAIGGSPPDTSDLLFSGGSVTGGDFTIQSGNTSGFSLISR